MLRLPYKRKISRIYDISPDEITEQIKMFQKLEIENQKYKKIKIPKKFKLCCIAYNLNSKKKFYEYCKNICIYFEKEIVLCYYDAHKDNMFSSHKNIFLLKHLTCASFFNVFIMIERGLLDDYKLKQITENICINLNITITPVAQCLIKNIITHYHKVFIMMPCIYMWKNIIDFL